MSARALALVPPPRSSGLRLRRAPRVHPSAEVSAQADIGEGVQIWHQAQVREGACVGEGCIVGKGVYIDHGVHVGARCKIQNYALLYHGLTVEDGVFIGPAACFTNDRLPRACNPDGSPKGVEDWALGTTTVCEGASVGAGAIVLPNLRIGRYAMVGAGALVTRSVPDHALVLGSPARQVGWVCRCGARLDLRGRSGWCEGCQESTPLLPEGEAP